MSINIGPPAIEELRPRITVIGVGGAGGNAIANMIAAEIEGVDFVVANTDAQALNSSVAEHRIQLGPDITQGLGAGSRPEVGRAAAEETAAEIERALDGVHMCFIAAGMGGDALAAQQHLQRGGCHPQLHCRADVLVRHRVVVALEGDVVVDVHPRRLELRQHHRLCRQRLEIGRAHV